MEGRSNCLSQASLGTSHQAFKEPSPPWSFGNIEDPFDLPNGLGCGLEHLAIVTDHLAG